MKIKWNWGTKLIIAMIAFMLMVVALVVRMAREDINLVEKDYYPKGQAYQELLDKVQNTLPYAAGILAWVQHDTILVSFPDFFEPKAVSGSIHFYNRTSESKDILVPLTPASDGVFRYPAGNMKGRYILKIDWKQHGVPYYTEKNLTLE